MPFQRNNPGRPRNDGKSPHRVAADVKLEDATVWVTPTMKLVTGRQPRRFVFFTNDVNKAKAFIKQSNANNLE